jgi:hypothetical protein
MESINNIKQEFFKIYYPGIKPNESILNMIQLLTTRSPDLMIRSWATSGYEMPVDFFSVPNVTMGIPQDKKIIDIVLDKNQGWHSQKFFVEIFSIFQAFPEIAATYKMVR